MKRCKITVLRRMYNEDLAHTYLPDVDFPPCDVMREGDVFYTGGPFGKEMPEGFCSGAWDAIKSHAVVLASGGKVFQRYNFNVACCNDGIRPVVFLLEAVEERITERYTNETHQN